MMTQLTPDLLETHLAQYGWTFESDGPNRWRTGFQGEQRFFPLSIKLSETCVSFEVKPLLDLEVDWQKSRALLRELLTLNARLQLVKLALHPDGDLVLACQVLTAGFDYEMLAHILGILGYYAEEVTPDIHAKLTMTGAAQPPTLHS